MAKIFTNPLSISIITKLTLYFYSYCLIENPHFWLFYTITLNGKPPIIILQGQMKALY
jgi:hypothetical protein